MHIYTYMHIWLELSWRDFFSCTVSLFLKLWWLILTTFYIPTLFSIGFPGQPCLRHSEKVSFGPVTSGFLPENHLWIWVIRGFPQHFPLLIIFFCPGNHVKTFSNFSFVLVSCTKTLGYPSSTLFHKLFTRAM